MKIGVISDTHDNIYAARKAVKIFNEEDVSVVLHAGDIISPFTVREFKPLRARANFILGNNDGEILHLVQTIKELNFAFHNRFYYGKIDGEKIAMVHGDTPIVESLIKSRMYDIVISGHTHQKKISEYSDVLYVNPGEACGYLTGEKSIAVIETKTMKAEIITF